MDKKIFASDFVPKDTRLQRRIEKMRYDKSSVEVLLARENGFCFGVKNAVALTETAADVPGAKVYNLGQVVHNPQIARQLQEKGARVVKSLDEVPEGTVVVRAHGISPQVRAEIEQKGLNCIDATCSLVLRAQKFTKQLYDEGYAVIILGTPGHPEVEGLVGFAPEHIVVENAQQWSALGKMKKVGVLTQSTQAPWVFAELVSYLTGVCQELKVFNTVCPITIKRQAALTELGEESDRLIVVGGKNSANTCELVNLARRQGKQAYHIEEVADIQKMWLQGCKRVGLIGGCSTAMGTLLDVKAWLETFHDDQNVVTA